MDELAEEFTFLMKELQKQAGEDIVFILGCTELSLLDKTKFKKFHYIDPLEILGLVAILKSGGRLQMNKLPYEYDVIKAISKF